MQIFHKAIINFKKIQKKLFNFFKPYYISFVPGHSYLNKYQLKEIKNLLFKNDEEIVIEYEHKFAKIIGSGVCFSYAAARMSFYEILRFKKIKKDDEIILLGFTCAVMANAVQRIGAKIVYCDLDLNNYGSCPESINSFISKNTKIIVAQHSFGIPCEIAKIVEIAKSKKIFLIEDCSLSLSSKFNNIILGNFGDAAIFSTDHTKPINTITGGMLYTKNKNLIKFINSQKKNYREITDINKKYLWDLFCFERIFCKPRNYAKEKLINLIYRKIFNSMKIEDNELLEDSKSLPSRRKTYPSKLPSFCALIGIFELANWEATKNTRKENLKNFLKFAKNEEINLPRSYFDERLEIIPLRLAFHDFNKNLLNRLGNYIDISSSWFKKPIIGTEEPLQNYQYKFRSCNKSENVCKRIVNIPVSISNEEFDKMLFYIKREQ